MSFTQEVIGRIWKKDAWTRLQELIDVNMKCLVNEQWTDFEWNEWRHECIILDLAYIGREPTKELSPK